MKLYKKPDKELLNNYISPGREIEVKYLKVSYWDVFFMGTGSVIKTERLDLRPGSSIMPKNPSDEIFINYEDGKIIISCIGNNLDLQV